MGLRELSKIIIQSIKSVAFNEGSRFAIFFRSSIALRLLSFMPDSPAFLRLSINSLSAAVLLVEWENLPNMSNPIIFLE
jgi:hypothetical protein